MSRKIRSYVTAQIQSSDSYESDNMYMLPYISGWPKNTPGVAKDEAVYGDLFKRHDIKTNNSVECTLEFNFDIVTFDIIKEALFAQSKLSMFFYSPIVSYECTSVYIKSFKLKGSVGTLWTVELDLFITLLSASITEPSYSAFGDAITFHESNFNILTTTIRAQSIELSCNNNLSISYDTIGLVTPVRSISQVSCSFTTKDSLNSIYDWASESTQLSADLFLNRFWFRFVNFIINYNFEDDESVKVNMLCGELGLEEPLGIALSTWSWDFDDGFFSFEQNPQHTFLVSGYYWVTRRLFYTQNGVDTYNDNKYLIKVFRSNTVLTYLWDFGDGSYSNEQNPQHTFTRRGFYWVTLTTIYTDGSVSKNKFLVKVYNSESYLWDFDDGNTDSGSPVSNTYVNPGNYTPQLASSGKYGEISTYSSPVEVL